MLNCACVVSKVDDCRKELHSDHPTDDQMLADDVNACHLETEHVHKVCNLWTVCIFFDYSFVCICKSYVCVLLAFVIVW